MIVEQLKLILEETANRYSRLKDKPDFDVAVEVNCDVNDAFTLGVDEGEITYARHLLELIDVLEKGI